MLHVVRQSITPNIGLTKRWTTPPPPPQKKGKPPAYISAKTHAGSFLAT